METLYYIALGSVSMLILGYLKTRYFDFLAQRPQDYASNEGQVFDLRQHLNGPLTCDGVIYGPTGRVASRFVAQFQAEWNGNQGVLKEHFVYDSGDQQWREWHLMVGNDGRIVATAPDVIGEGAGVQSGSTFQLKYRIKLPEESGGHVLDTTDWMYLTPSGTIVNRSQFRKFGIKVAELVATMRRSEPA